MGKSSSCEPALGDYMFRLHVQTASQVFTGLLAANARIDIDDGIVVADRVAGEILDLAFDRYSSQMAIKETS